MGDLIETEIGTIAPDWKVGTLGEMCEPPQYGYTASAEDSGNAHFLRITDIEDSGVKWPTVPFCECPADLIDKYRLVSGDIVFARIGATTGKSYLISNPPLSVFASYLIRVRVKRDLDPAFLSHFFRSAVYWRQVDAQKNSNLKKGVNGSVLKTLLVPVPPLTEQRRIAGVLGLVQRAVEQQERLRALVAELKQSLLHHLFTHGLRGDPQKPTDLGPIPQSWDVTTLAAGVIMANLSNAVLDRVPVSVPSMSEQTEITLALDQKERLHARKHSALTSLFRTLLHQLMTAQLRVADLDVDGLLESAH